MTTETAEQQAVLERLTQIRQNIAEACAAAGRNPEDVTLMAVTKTVAPELINTAITAGVHVLGENRVQEYLSKCDQYLPDAEVQFIGHLQTNKVRQIISRVTMIHSVDSLHLAEAIDKEAAKAGLVMPVLMEVNIGGELSKSGSAPEQAEALLEGMMALPHIKVNGLMTIPPPAFDESEQMRTFTDMYSLFERLQRVTPMQTLSMGMSGDYAAAIRCGSTMVRIGSGLFGARVYPQKPQ